jgi:hypothetical protein
MKLLEGVKTPTTGESQYCNLSLVKLVRTIVDKGDRRALEEFHNNRTLFRYSGGPPSRFIDYLNELRESAAKRFWSAPKAFEVAEKAYDLTIEKFNNLPGQKKPPAAKNQKSRKVKRGGASCRYYLRAFLERAAWSFVTKPPANQIQEEARAAMVMQGLVERHFYLSLLEAERKANPFWSRYNWKVRGRTICVWLPVSLAGRERRRWLEKNIDNPDPLREGERARIQAVIDSNLVRGGFVPLSEAPDGSNEDEFLRRFDSGETFGISLAEAVAEEKTRNIHQQRRSIRALGKKRLKKLIVRIFEDIDSGEYKDEKIASQFKLSKATFSRFAGSRWLLSPLALPDLWRNTAQILSKQPDLKEVAVSTGVWGQVQSALQRDAPVKGGETNHD